MHLDSSTIRNAVIGMGQRGLTLAKFLVELVVRVDDERLLESLEGLALGFEYFHDGQSTIRWFGRKGLPISVCLSVHASYLVNDVRSTRHAALLLAKCTLISSELSRHLDKPLEGVCGSEEVASYALRLGTFLWVWDVFFSHLTLPRMQTTIRLSPTQPSCSSMQRGSRHSTRPSLPSQSGIGDTTVESDRNACVGSPQTSTCPPNSQVSPIAAIVLP